MDAAIGITFELEYVTMNELEVLGKVIIDTFKLLTGLIDKEKTHNSLLTIDKNDC